MAEMTAATTVVYSGSTTVFCHSEPNGVNAAAAMPTSAPQTAPPPRGLTPNSSLYVGDLDASVNEPQLFNLFNQVAEVVSVRVCTDHSKQPSLGYAYVNFKTHEDAARAMKALNYTPVNGKPIRIMFSNRDPTLRKNEKANLFIKNLEASIDNKALHDVFAVFGNILSCKVATDNNGNSKGYAFVQFEQEEAAQKAIEKLNGMCFNDKQVYVGLFVPKEERNKMKKHTNVYVKNLPETTTGEDLGKIFGEYGSITSSVVVEDANGKSRCFGFVNFQNHEDATAAIENLNGASLGDKVLYVGKAKKKADRQAELKDQFEKERKERLEKQQGANLYLKNLHDSITDEELNGLFSPYGTITSAKVMVDSVGRSKGSGFVAFSSPGEAKRALTAMNGKMIGKKPLYVSIAQRKEERKAILQSIFAPAQQPSEIASLPSMPVLPPQHVYFSQCPALIQPYGYGFQQQVLPRVYPSVAPNFIMPYHGKRGGVNPHTLIQGVDRHVADGQNSDQGLIGSMMPYVASSSSKQQQNLLGEQLYPLVEGLEPENAQKITGMLLEMDQTEVLHLIESPDALKAKVDEAMEVLRLSSSDQDDVDGEGL